MNRKILMAAICAFLFLAIINCAPVAKAADAPAATAGQQPPCGTGPMALMYHTITDSPSGQWELATATFEAQMKFLKDNNCNVVDADTYASIIKSGAKTPAILLSFDDRTRASHYTVAFPILKKYGLRAIFFVQSSQKGITTAQLKEMISAGMVMGSHTITHPTSAGQWSGKEYELKQSKDDLEKELGVSIKYLAWPGNYYNSALVQKAKDAGYEGLFAVAKEENNKQLMVPTTSQYEMFRREIGNGCAVDMFKLAVSNNLCCIPKPDVKMDISQCVPYNAQAVQPTSASNAPPSLGYQDCAPGAVTGGGALNLQVDSEGLVEIPQIDGKSLCVDDAASRPGGCRLKKSAAEAIYSLYKMFKDNGCTLQISSAYRSQALQATIFAALGSGKACGPGKDNFAHCPHVSGGAIDIMTASCPDYEKRMKLACQAGWMNYNNEGWHFEFGTTSWKGAVSQQHCQFPFVATAGYGGGAYAGHQSVKFNELAQQPNFNPQSAGAPSSVAAQSISIKELPTVTAGGSTINNVKIIEIDPKYYDIKTMSAKTIIQTFGGASCDNCKINIVDAKKKYPSLNIVAGVNAGFFDNAADKSFVSTLNPGTGAAEKLITGYLALGDAVDYSAYGYPVNDYVENGKLIKGKPDDKLGMYFVVDNGAAKIIKKSDFSFSPSITSAVSGSSSAEGETSRTMACIEKDGKIKLVTAKSASASALKDYLTSSENCGQTINLDGGGSTMIYYNDGAKKVEDAGSDSGGRAVANFLVAVPKAGMGGVASLTSPVPCPPASVYNSQGAWYATYLLPGSFSTVLNQNLQPYTQVQDTMVSTAKEPSCGVDCFDQKTNDPALGNKDYTFYYKQNAKVKDGKESDWSKYCESPDEAFFSDFAEFFDNCIGAAGQNCNCKITPDPKALEKSSIKFSKMSGTRTDISLTGYDKTFQMFTKDYSVAFPSEIKNDGGIRLAYSATDAYNPGASVKMSTIYLNKEGKKISFSSSPLGGDCNAESQVIKVCAVSKSITQKMDNPVTGKFEEMPLTFRFAFTPPNTPPPDVAGVAVSDLKYASGAVVLSWYKSTVSNVEKYDIYQQASDFKGKKSDEVKKTAAPATVEIKNEKDVQSVDWVPKCKQKGTKQCDFELEAKSLPDGAASQRIPMAAGTLIYEAGTGKYYYITALADKTPMNFGVTAENKKGIQSAAFVETPAGISIDDIPPGYSDYSGAMVSGNTRTFEMPQANIDGTVLGPFMKLYYYIVESCPSGNRAIAQYPSDAGKPLSLTQQAIPSISGGCSYKLIVQKDVSSLTMVQAYSPFVNNVDFQGTKDLEVINYLLQ